MKNRLRLEVEKNGKRLGSAGCPDRGVLSVSIALPEGQITSHAIIFRGELEDQDDARWSFGPVRVGDVVTFRLIEGGSISQPRKRERSDRARTERMHREFMRRLVRQISQLEEMLARRTFPPREPPPARVGQLALRVWLDEREFLTVGARNADEVSVTVGGTLGSRSRHPSFEIDGTAWTQREVTREYRGWRRTVRRGTSVIRVEVLPSARPSSPETRRRSKRKIPPSNILEGRRELASVRASAVAAEKWHREHLQLIRRIELDRLKARQR